MSLQSGLLPNPTLFRRGRRSRLLFHWRGRDLSLSPLTPQVPTFSRASAGGAVLDRYGNYYTPVHSQNRYEMVDLDGDGIRETAGLVLEPSRGNLALWSSDFSNAVWAGGTDFTQSNVASVIAGQVARKHVNLNTASNRTRGQIVGTLSTAGDTVYFIVENVDADTTGIMLFDSTSSTVIVRGIFTWATRAFAVDLGSGSVFAVKLAEVGPNGGPIYLLGVSGIGTAGNGRQINIYPTGTTQNAKTVIVHHGQLEGAQLSPTSPIVTGAASVTRSRDSYEAPASWPMQTLSLYLRYVSRGYEGHAVVAAIPFSIGQVGAATRLQFQMGAAATNITLTLSGTAGGNTSGMNVASVVPGTLVELFGWLRYTPLTASATLQAAIALGGADPTSTAVSSAIAVSPAFQGAMLALGAISGNTTVDYSATFLSAKIAAGVLATDQIREAL